MKIHAPAVTGSITITPNLTVTGSTLLGTTLSATHTMTGSFAVTGSISLNGQQIITSGDYTAFSGSVSTRVTNLESTASVLTTASASFALVSASYSSFSGSYRTGSFTGSFVGSLQGTSSWAVNAVTASTADNFVVRQSLTGSNALFTGAITAQTLVVQTVTSSIVYSSGSNKFGDELTDVQEMTGSVRITGSLSVNGTSVPTGTGTSGQVVYFNGTTSITGESNLFWDATNDRLGIGTATPTYTFDTWLTTGTGYQLVARFLGGTNANGNAGGITLGSTQTQAGYIYGEQKATTGGDLVFGTQYIGAYNERMRIASNGNVGIGTAPYGTFPDSKLHVYGTRSNTINSANAIAKIGGSDVYIGFGALDGTPNYGAWIQSSRYSDDLGFPLMLNPTNSANVLIGTSTNSTYKLDVNGTARFSGDIISSVVNGYALIIDRPAVTNYNGISYRTNNSAKWFVGLRGNLSSDNYIINNETVGSDYLTLDTSGNLGLGVTPSAWGSGRTALQIGNDNSYFVGSRNTVLVNNAYNNGTNWIYLTSGVNAHVYAQLEGGNHAWYTAPSSTAGQPITFTQAMTLDSSGRLGIGITAPDNKLVVYVGKATAAFNTGITILSGDASYTTGDGGMLQWTNEDVITAGIRGSRDPGSWASALSFYTHTSGTGNTFNTTFTEKMRITHDGNVGIGTTSPGSKLTIVSDDLGLRVLGSTRAQIILEASKAWQIETPYGSGNVPAGALGIVESGVGTRLTILSGSGNVGVGTTTPSGIIHVRSTGIAASQPQYGWPVYNAELDPSSSRAIYVDTGGNGPSNTAGNGATVSLILGQYYDSRAVITTIGAGGDSPSDQGTGYGKDLMIKAGTSDNGAGKKGGKLYLNGGMGYQSAYNTNVGDIVMQGMGGGGYVGIGTKNPSATLTVSGSHNILILTSSNYNQSFEITFNSNANSFFEAFNEQGENAWYNYTYSGSYRYDFIGYDGMFFRYGHPYGQSNIMEPFSTRSNPFLLSYWPGGSNEANATLDMEIRDHRWVGVNGNSFAKFTSSGSFAISDSGTYYEMQSKVVNSPIIRLRHSGTTQPIGMWVEFSAASPDNNTEYFFRGSDSTTDRIYIYSDGDLANHDGVYGSISDIKLKQDIVDATAQWDDIKNIRFRKYRLKKDVEINPNAPYLLGVVAQELELTSPGLVESHPDFKQVEVPALSENGEQLKDSEGNLLTKLIDEPTGTYTKTVKSSILLMKAAKALQEAIERIEVLEAEIQLLKSKLS